MQRKIISAIPFSKTKAKPLVQVGVIGINHKLATLSQREQLAKRCEQYFVNLSRFHGKHTCVLLSTCNRTELYFSSDHLSLTHSYLLDLLRDENKETLDQKLYSYFHEDCFEHLAKVTAGLDSAIIAETEIQGQVKAAYESAVRKHPLPSSLHYLFQKSLKIGKQIRQSMPERRLTLSLEHAIYQAGLHFFSGLPNKKILFIGASEINKKILSFLQKKGVNDLTLCNRSPVKEEIQTLPWQNFGNWTQYDWIILATKSQEHLIKKNDPLHHRSKLIMDLSVPRNVDPKVGRQKDVTLLNIDQIQRTLKIKQKRDAAIFQEAKGHLQRSVQKQIAIYERKQDRREQILKVVC